MLQAIKYCLANLGRLSGRDARQTFWFYVLFLVIAQFVISFAISIPISGRAMMTGIEAAREHLSPDQAQALVMQQLAGSIRVSMYVSIVTSLLLIALVYAAFVRRLHDSGKPGWIAAVIAVLKLAALGFTISRINAFIALVASGRAARMQGAAGMQNHPLPALFEWLPFLIVVVFGVLGSTPGPNRYGPEPDADDAY